MECLDCGVEPDAPTGEPILLDDIFDDHVDVDLSVEEHVQLECPECGAVMGYLATGAAVGSQNIRGFY